MSESRNARFAGLGRVPHSISQLTEGSRLTQQAITKHLRVLESVGIVHSSHRGSREPICIQPAAD
jgi:DNA-binding transcriptional ArsR family regulator